MKNSLIFILVIIVIVIGWLLYFFRDNVKNIYDNTSVEINEEIIDVKEEIDETIVDVKEDISDGIEDIKK